MLTSVRKTPENNPYLLDIPIPISVEQSLNFHLPLIHTILKEITSKFSRTNANFFLSGTPDVLNSTDYPVIHDLFFDFLKKSRKLSKYFELPAESIRRKKILRDPLTNQEMEDSRRQTIVKTSGKAPLCFRFAIMEETVHLGDIFLIPVITNRIASQAVIEKKHRVSYDVVVATIDAQARKDHKRSRSKKDDSIIIALTQQYNNPVNPLGFSFVADKSMREDASTLNFGQMMVQIMHEWREQQFDLSRRKSKRILR